MWLRGEDDTAIAGGEGGFGVFLSVLVEEGVVAFGSEVALVEQVGEFAAEGAMFHVSVRLL